MIIYFYSPKVLYDTKVTNKKMVTKKLVTKTSTKKNILQGEGTVVGFHVSWWSLVAIRRSKNLAAVSEVTDN